MKCVLIVACLAVLVYGGYSAQRPRPTQFGHVTNNILWQGKVVVDSKRGAIQNRNVTFYGVSREI